MSNSEGETEVSEKFQVTMKKLLFDMMRTFPECKHYLDDGSMDIILNKRNTQNIKELYDYCLTVFPERIFDIMYKREEIFEDANVNTKFLPNIDFSELWNQNISDNTKNILWSYLNLLLMIILEDVEDAESFGDARSFFEAMDPEVLTNKLSEILGEMTNMGDNSNNINNINNMFSDISGLNDMFNMGDGENMFNMGDGENMFNMDGSNNMFNMGDMPNPDDINEHINKLMGGNLGRLAKEIAKETAGDLEEEMGDLNNVGDVFKKLFKDPMKLMSIIKRVGSKLEQKIKSGEINESELIKETSELLGNMKNMPGMEGMEKMMKQMAKNMGGKVNINQMQSHMKQNMRQAKQKERMRKKMEERRKLREQRELLEKMRMTQSINGKVNVSKTNVDKAVDDNYIIKKCKIGEEGEVVQKSKRKKKKKKRKKKKNK